MRLDIAVSLPRERRSVALIRSIVTNTLLVFGVAPECAEDIRLAISEACANVVEHAGADDEYQVEVHVAARTCTIDVINTGVGFDAADLSGTLPDVGSSRGRGVAIMKAVMDSVQMRSSPEAGTLVHLSRALDYRDDDPLNLADLPAAIRPVPADRASTSGITIEHRQTAST